MYESGPKQGKEDSEGKNKHLIMNLWDLQGMSQRAAFYN